MNKISNFYDKFYTIQKRTTKIEEMKQDIRVNVIRKFLRKDNRTHKKILIVGCGSEKDLSITRERIIAIDISSIAIKIAKKRFPHNTYFVADACYLPFANNFFDCIVCSEVMEHVVDSNKMLFEFQRVLCERGTVIITVPNWYSFYGMFRKLAEFITRHSVTAGNQPIDNWYTPGNLKIQLNRHFRIEEIRGIWYYPPMGRGKYMAPSFLVHPIFKALQPIDWFLGRILPKNGHMYAVRCTKIMTE
ncbi:methyltransferase domain-containing protein [bacterium]|nr:methyltransferase domain-containing protein [bacterium]NIN92557.1 methyltransferase domain-containing protein [bacterium]NIO18599.1 methyltransferase domain-containing protein [bacterium]NIO73614.1 methyltransferase domain-containing protein [bacterium]